MRIIDIISKPCVLCPINNTIVLLVDCPGCKYFYGFTSPGDKIGCEYPDTPAEQTKDGTT